MSQASIPRNPAPASASTEPATGDGNEFLEPVTTPTDAISAGADEDHLAPSRPVAEPVRMVRCPCCRAEYPIGDLLDAATGTPWDPAPVNCASDRQTVSVMISPDRPSPAPGSSVAPGLSGERPRKKERGLLGEMIQVILGGVVGLSVTYYGLNYFGGPQFDYLKVFLPGVSHTYSHRPSWWPAWPGSPDADEGPEEPFEPDSP